MIAHGRAVHSHAESGRDKSALVALSPLVALLPLVALFLMIITATP